MLSKNTWGIKKVPGQEEPVTKSSDWGEPEQAPHWSVVDVYVGASRCA